MAIGLLAVGSARAATLAFSDASSDTTPAAWLAATLDYSLIDASTLEIRVTNETAAPAAFDITLVFFNTAPEVEYLSLLSAVSSLDGPNTDAWYLGHYGYDRAHRRFGEFDYSLRTATGAPERDRISPGETQIFTLSAACARLCRMPRRRDRRLERDGRDRGARAALRFAYGPNGDAGFGASFRLASVPEPHSAALLALGLALLAERAGAAALSQRSSSTPPGRTRPVRPASSSRCITLQQVGVVGGRPGAAARADPARREQIVVPAVLARVARGQVRERLDRDVARVVLVPGDRLAAGPRRDVLVAEARPRAARCRRCPRRACPCSRRSRSRARGCPDRGAAARSARRARAARSC